MPTLEARVRGIERRLATVERLLAIEAAPAPAPVKRPAPPPPPSRPAPKPAPKPARSFEVDVGRWLLSRLGGLSLVVAAGFLFHYAAQQGWLGPQARLLLGSAAGLGLVAAGEWQSRRLRRFSAALTGTGIAILYVCDYAGYGLYGFYGSSMALSLASLVTIAGVTQALRHGVQAIAGLAVVGGFLAPLLILDPHAEPVAILLYVLVVDVGVCFLRARRGWIATEVIAWIGTILVAAVPLTRVDLPVGISFLLAYALVFGLRPRLSPARLSAVHSYVANALVALGSYALFQMDRSDGWAVMAGSYAAVLAVSAWLTARRSPSVAGADLLSAAVIGMLAVFDGFRGWEVTLGFSAIAATLLLAPRKPLMAPEARSCGFLVLAFTLPALIHTNVENDPNLLLAYLAAAGAVAAIRLPAAFWGAAGLAALGIGLEVAAALDAETWSTVLLYSGETVHPSHRLIVGACMAAVFAATALVRRDRPNLIRVGVYAGLLVAVEILYMIEGVSVAPAGMIAAAALVAGCPWSRTIWAVAAALAVAVAADLIPPADYLPFLNRRAFAVGGVLAAGWWLLRRREEGRAVALLGILLGAAELASLVDRGGGLSPWGHLVLDMRAAGDLAPLLNSRFLFLLGAAGAAFVGARRWRHLAIAGHVYLAAALGAEAVGLVEPGLRADPWSAFVSAGNHMAEHLALTGVILVYGAGLVTAGILRGRPLARRVGLGMLVFGAAKVSLFDLTALGDLYRVGSFVVLGSTFLMGSYAYHRWVSTEKRFENDTDPAEVSPQGYE